MARISEYDPQFSGIQRLQPLTMSRVVTAGLDIGHEG
jgi:hypothetical protein